jgi:dipeptidyl aminopeptidase/acylaminoacyl peptidase
MPSCFKKLTLGLAVLLAASAAPTSGRAQAFSLQQVMSAPFSSELHAAPVGSAVVWIANQEGRRNLWIADAANPATPARRLTAYLADDGQDLGDVTFTPDGQSVLYVRGGDFEFPSRPLPNPAQIAAGVDQSIYIVPVAGGPPRKLAEGRIPAVSPDGKLVAFLAKEQIYTLSLSDPTAKPTQFFHARGAIGPPIWSPDSKFVAFTSSRGDHGFIGVYSLAAHTITYLAPSTNTDDAPVWSPDSRSIAFIRLFSRAPSAPMTNWRREGAGWAIVLADAATGEGHEIFHAKPGPGSVFHALATSQQLFFTGGKIIFPSEQDGYEHLYAVPLAGGEAKLLTPGTFEVEHVASAANDTVIYSSNQFGSDPKDEDRRHLWQVAADGRPSTQLSSGDGIETFPAVTATGAVVALSSDGRLPTHPAVIAGGKVIPLAAELTPKDYPASKLVVPQPVTITAADGMLIHGQLFLPANVNDGKRHPALTFFHGGSRRQMLLGYHYMDYYSNSYAMNQYLASLGYIVLSVNYRSGIGYGLNFREAINYGQGGASEYNDVLGAGLYLRNRPDVDPSRIGSWGGSYGGYLTALALARSSDLFAAGVDFHGVHDWNLNRNFQPSATPAAADADTARLAFDSSPLSSIKTWRSPVLLIQGDDDRNVPFTQTVRLAAALREKGVPVEEHVFPDEIHAFLLHRSWITSYGLTADFFQRKFGTNPH